MRDNLVVINVSWLDIDFVNNLTRLSIFLGLIGKIKFDSDNPSSQWTYYKVKKNDEDNGCVACEIENNKQINALKFKLDILYSLLTLSNISINEDGITVY